MPRTGPRRRMVGAKFYDVEIDAVDRRALEEGLTIRGGEPNRSEMLRLLVAFAMANMPSGWRPTERATGG